LTKKKNFAVRPGSMRQEPALFEKGFARGGCPETVSTTNCVGEGGKYIGISKKKGGGGVLSMNNVLALRLTFKRGKRGSRNLKWERARGFW